MNLPKLHKILNLIEESLSSKFYYAFDEIVDEQYPEIIDDYLNGKERIDIIRVPAPRFKKIWLDMGKTGVVRDTKGLLRIRDTLIHNLARLVISTELSGHTESDPSYSLEKYGFYPQQFSIDKEDWEEVDYYDDVPEKFFDYLNDENDNYFFIRLWYKTYDATHE